MAGSPLTQPPTPSTAVEAELGRLRLYSPSLLNATTSHRGFFRWIGALLVATVLAMFLPWQQNVQGEGTVSALSPQDRPQTLPTLIDGRIEQWYVKEGDYVRQGDPIVRISEVKEEYLDPNVIQRTEEQRDAKSRAVGDKQNVAAALEQQVVVLEQALALKLSQTENKIRQYEADVRAAVVDSANKADQALRREGLFNDGLVDKNSYQTFVFNAQKAAADLAEKRAGLQNARIDLDAARAEYTEKIVKARADRAKTLAEVNEGQGEVSKLANKVSSLKVRAGFYEIRAPQDGYVVQAVQTGLGETVKANDAIVTVQPARPQRAVELWVKPMDVTLLQRGDHVRLEFNGFPALQFSGWPSVSVGTFGGTVSNIDLVSGKGGKFRLLVVEDTTRGDPRWPEQLRIGTDVYGWTMLREVRVWYEIWRQLNGFPPSVSAPTEPAFDAKKGGDPASTGMGAKKDAGK